MSSNVSSSSSCHAAAHFEAGEMAASRPFRIELQTRRGFVDSAPMQYPAGAEQIFGATLEHGDTHAEAALRDCSNSDVKTNSRRFSPCDWTCTSATRNHLRLNWPAEDAACIVIELRGVERHAVVQWHAGQGHPSPRSP